VKIIFKNFWPVLAWALLVLILMGLPGNYFPVVPSVWDLLEPDKIVHVFIFAVFTILMAFGITRRYSTSRHSLAIALQAIGTGILYGGITELMQGYVFTGRTESIYDFTADCVGCIVGYLIFRLLVIKYMKKMEQHPE
jgi:VanZ family protein